MKTPRIGKIELYARAMNAWLLIGRAERLLGDIAVRGHTRERAALKKELELFQGYARRAGAVAIRNGSAGVFRNAEQVRKARLKFDLSDARDSIRHIRPSDRKALWLEFRAEIEAAFAEADRQGE